MNCKKMIIDMAKCYICEGLLNKFTLTDLN